MFIVAKIDKWWELVIFAGIDTDIITYK